MATFRSPVGNFTFETFAAFVGALLVVPLVIKLVFGIVRTILGLGIVRRLFVEALFAGLAVALTRENVLDRLFGRKGQPGSGLLKPDVNR